MDMQQTPQYRNITISGRIATGTSTLAKNLVEALPSWKRINAGDIQREFDRTQGVDERFTGSDTRTDEHEKEIEKMTKEKLTNEQHLVYEAWLSGFVARGISGILKVLLVCDDALRIDRVVNRDQLSVDEAKRQIETREKGNIKKWHALYGLHNFWDPNEFDLIIDTYSTGPIEARDMVLKKLFKKK